MSQRNGHICFIEDDEVMGGALSLRFELEGYDCDWFKTGRPALQAIMKNRYDAVVCDIRLPDISGEDIYTSLLERGGHVPPFLFITGYGAMDQAVRLVKRGAADYLLKPFEPDMLLARIAGLAKHGVHAECPAGDTLGPSPAMRSLDGMLSRVAASPASILITGESGVGKERIARKLHRLGGGSRPFVAVNCAALTESLLEAELFGFEKGAFTGATRNKKGVFELAHGGTLFLDEIGETSAAMQVKLLRAIQERQIVRVGGEKPIPVDLRIIAATNQDLRNLVEQGVFRDDLYYRVNVVQLKVPPLRERKEDILWLAEQFLEEYFDDHPGTRKMLSPAAVRALLDYPWPGNVRELKHMLESALLLTEGPVLAPDDLFETPPRRCDAPECSLGDYLAECERAYIRRGLTACDWQIQETARLLGISRKSLWMKMKKLDIKRDAGKPTTLA